MSTNNSDEDVFEGSSPDAVPDGIYDAMLTSVEITETKFGTRRRWIFALTSMDDFEVSQFTSPKFSGKSRGNEFVSALIGHKLAPKEKVARSSLIGRPCRLVLGTNDGGWNTIEAIRPEITGSDGPKFAAGTIDDAGWLD